jgi:hypothetical protein
MKSLGVSPVRSLLSLRTVRFQAQTSFHEWGRKQGLASDPESTPQEINRWRRQTERDTANYRSLPNQIMNALNLLSTDFEVVADCCHAIMHL